MRTDLTWEYSERNEQWELGCYDPADVMIYGPNAERIVVGFVTCEFLERVPMDRPRLEAYLLERFRVPLPEEAYRDAGR